MGNIESFDNTDTKPLVVIYETSKNNENLEKLKKLLTLNNYSYTILGQGDKWHGFGTKILACLKFYKSLNKDKIIIQLDARDVLVNQSFDYFSDLLKKYYDKHQNAVNKLIISTEKGCCVLPAYKFGPESFFDSDLNRIYRTYESSPTFHHRSEWIDKFNAMNDSSSNKLNAGMILGKAEIFIKVFELLKIDKREDDQTLLSDFFFARPDLIHLDYENMFFSNSFSPVHNLTFAKSNCFEWKNNKWYNEETMSYPVFIQTPGKNWECYNKLYSKLSIKL